MSFIPKSGPLEGRVSFLNSTARIIYELCDGLHSVEEIVWHIKNNFKGEEIGIDRLRKDVYDCLYSLRNMELISWKDDILIGGPNMGKATLEISNKVMEEANIFAVSKFIQDSLKKKNGNVRNFITSKVDNADPRYYDPYLIRMRHLYAWEIFFIALKGKEICGVVSVMNFNVSPLSPSLGMVILPYGEKDNFHNKALMSYVIQVMKKLGTIKMKYTVPIPKNEKIPEDVTKSDLIGFLKGLDFLHEATLHDEIADGVDAWIFSKRI